MEVGENGEEKSAAAWRRRPNFRGHIIPCH